MMHDDVIKWNHIPYYWPFVRGIHRSTRRFDIFYVVKMNKELNKQSSSCQWLETPVAKWSDKASGSKLLQNKQKIEICWTLILLIPKFCNAPNNHRMWYLFYRNVSGVTEICKTHNNTLKTKAESFCKGRVICLLHWFLEISNLSNQILWVNWNWNICMSYITELKYMSLVAFRRV